MERVIYKHIYNYILEHSLLYAYQSGFLKGHSTVYQLLEIYHNACQNLDKRLSTIIIFCDISKAFDRVWHVGLIYKSCDRTEYLVRFWTGSRTTSATDNKLFFHKQWNFKLWRYQGRCSAGFSFGPLLFLLYKWYYRQSA
jgi:hypothetical protein